MKKLLFLLFITLVLCTAIGCSTKYIKIQEPDKVYYSGKPIYSVDPGDELEILSSQTCLGGKGTCYKVRNVKTGKIGFVYAKRMQSIHEIYEK